MHKTLNIIILSRTIKRASTLLQYLLFCIIAYCVRRLRLSSSNKMNASARFILIRTKKKQLDLLLQPGDARASLRYFNSRFFGDVCSGQQRLQ